MPDKQLLRLLGEDKRYIYRAVAWMLTGSLGSIGFTACLCYGLHLLLTDAKASFYLLPFALGAVCGAVRFLATIRAAAVRDRLGRSVKKSLRTQLYAKLLRLGVRETKTVKMAGLTQLATEGIEQLDLYYSAYLPQFFYAMLSPLLLFGICVFLNWRVAAVLLACVPLIPVSIVAVSRFAKRIFAKYWGQYTAMGDVFLDSVQGLKELKLFRADARRQAYMNENAEEFRKITMKVLVMQLASVTIMDLVAFGGAGIGAALAVSGTQNGGGIAAALFLVLVAAEFFLPLRAFGSAFHVAMNGVSAGRLMLALLEEPEPAWGEGQPCGGRLELEDVHFSYEQGRETLHGVSAVFPERGMTAIVGESGCGKTTVAKLLTGALRPDSGRVLLDGKPVESLDRQAYYASLAHVSCETFLFHDTIRSNFLLANPHATEEEMWRALALVRLDGLVRERGGLDFVLNEDAADISGGQMRYNGADIDEINTESLYRNVTMVSQSTYLFDATIAENLRIAKPDATDEELMAALRMASAEELVQALPQGLNTPAGLLGGRLSMGERQRIGLARAFLSGCPLILLDEPTSNVDSINEGVILRALLKHRQGRTIILVSHRASTMAVADRIYKMENGQMKEQAI